MKRYKFRDVGAYAVVLLLLFSVTVVGVIKIGNDGSTEWFNDVVMIKNSNGKIWSPSQSNLQLALNDLTSGGTVWLPSGTIDITTTIYINNDGVTLQGANGGSWETDGATILELDANTDILNINGTESDHISRVKVEDIKFYNNGRTQSGSAINIEYCLNPQIENCGFNRIKGSAIYFKKWVYGSKVINCDFQNCGDTNDYTVHFHGGATENMTITTPVIENCIFERSNIRDIGDDGQTYSCKRAMVKNNYFEGYNNSGTTEPADGHIRGTMIYSTIVDNNFIDQHDVVPYGVKLSSYGCIVKGNRFEGFTTGIELTQHWSVVSDNYLFEFRTSGIHLYQDHCTVTGNVLKAGGARGIHMETTYYGTVVGNTVDDTDSYAIYLQSCKGMVCNGNSLIDGADGIYSLNSENNTIVANVIFDMTDDGIDLNTGANNNVGMNVFSGCTNNIETSDTDLCYNNEGLIKNSNGDMWTPSATNLKSALNLGGTIYLPECNITGHFDINISGTQLIGNGQSVLTRATVTDQHCIDINANDVLIENIEVWGDRATDGSANGKNCIIVRPDNGYRNITIRDCVLHSSKASVVKIGAETENVVVDNCVIYDSELVGAWEAGIYANGNGHKFINNKIYDTYACGIVIEEGSGMAELIMISNNEIFGNIDHGIHMEQGYSSRCVIDGNVVHNTTDNGAYATTCYGIKGSSNSVVSNNVVYAVPGDAIEVQSDCVVDGNVVFNCTGFGVYANTRGCVLTGNKIENVTGDGLKINGDYMTITGNYIEDIPDNEGIAMTAGSDWNVVTGNNIYNVGRHGIRLYDSDYNVVSGNHLKDIGGGSYHGISIQGDFASITGNVIYNSADGINTNSAENCTIVSNVIIGMSDDGIDLNTGNYNNVGYNVISGCGTGIESSDGGGTVTADNIIS